MLYARRAKSDLRKKTLLFERFLDSKSAGAEFLVISSVWPLHRETSLRIAVSSHLYISSCPRTAASGEQRCSVVERKTACSELMPRRSVAISDCQICRTAYFKDERADLKSPSLRRTEPDRALTPLAAAQTSTNRPRVAARHGTARRRARQR